MKSSKVKYFPSIAIGAVLAGSAYWAGYEHGGSVAMAASAAAAVNKKSGSSEKGVPIAAVSKEGVAETLASLLSGPVRPGSDLLDRWAKGLSLQECLDNVKQLQALPAGQPRDDILKALVDAWAKKDPKSLLVGADGIAVPKLRENGVESALQHLAATDPKQALDWINQNADNASNADVARRMAQAINGYAKVDPQGALSAVLALSDGNSNDRQIKTKAVEGLADGMAKEGNFTNAIAFFNQLPAGKLQNDGLAEVVDNWAQVAPLDAANWVATVQDPSLLNDAGQNLTDAWANSDPAAAAKWAVQMDLQTAGASANGSNNGDTLLSHVIDSWSKYDLTAAGQFLNQLPSSPTKDAAIVSFVSRAAQDNPADTLKWVATMSDMNLQAKAFMRTARQWTKQDPAAFNQFMTTTTALTDAQKQAVANALNEN